MAQATTALRIAKSFVQDCQLAGLTLNKAFLFGSHATGKAHEWSDIDLLLVSDRFVKNSFENLKIYSDINIRYPDVEVHAYPTDYFLREGDPFLQDVLKYAIEIKLPTT